MAEDLTCHRLRIAGAVGRYVAGSLPKAEIPGFEEHLLCCPGCRDEVRIAAGLRTVFTEHDAEAERQARRRLGGWFRVVLGSGLAAAVLAGVLILGPEKGREAVSSRPPHRDRGSSLQGEGVAAFTVVEPQNEAVLPPDALKFIWHAPAEDAFYSFTLTDEAGDLVWQGTTRDSTLDLSTELRLQPGRYFWYVDARTDDARTASTGAHEFRVIR